MFVLTAENKLAYLDNKQNSLFCIDNKLPEFVPINFDSIIVDIKSNSNFSMMLTADGIVYHDTYENDVNNVNNVDAIKPVNFGFNVIITKIACGGVHSMALDINGRVYTWGDNSDGQLGLGDTEKRTEPQLVNSLADKYITQIAAGRFFSVFVEADTNIYTCGSNNNGTLGLGLGLSKIDCRTIPTQVNLPINANVRTVQCSEFHVIVLTGDNKVYVWGSGIFNAIGMTSKDIPTNLVIKEKNNCPIMAVYAGESCTTILYDDAVYTCGKNHSGQLGLGHREIVRTHTAIPFFDHNQLVIIRSSRNVKSAVLK